MPGPPARVREELLALPGLSSTPAGRGLCPAARGAGSPASDGTCGAGAGWLPPLKVLPQSVAEGGEPHQVHATP